MLAMNMGTSNAYNTKGKDEARNTAIKSRGIPGLLHIEGHNAPSSFKKSQTREEKDFMSSNVRRLRQSQRENRHREKAQIPQTPTKDLWKSAKFKDVQSRFKTGRDSGLNGYPVRPSSSHEFLRGHSRPNTANGQRPATSSTRPSSANMAKTNSHNDLNVQAQVERLCLDDDILEKPEVDYIKLNGRLAKHSVVNRSASEMAMHDLQKYRQSKYCNYKKGVVPKYLKERQNGWQKDEEERIRNEPDPDLPEGHRKLPEKERIETLEKLQQNERDLLEKMQSLPICGQTFRVKQQNLMFNQQLSEIAEAIKIFSRTKVFVKLDETPRQ